jgi:hypothetical protein
LTNTIDEDRKTLYNKFHNYLGMNIINRRIYDTFGPHFSHEFFQICFLALEYFLRRNKMTSLKNVFRYFSVFLIAVITVACSVGVEDEVILVESTGLQDAPPKQLPQPTEIITESPAPPPLKEEKYVKTFIGKFYGGYVHQISTSTLQWLLKVYGRVPEPVPNAEVSIRMTKPNGSSETMKAMTDAEGIASAGFTIDTYGDYTLAVENIQGENFDYVPELNATTSIEVSVGPGENPVPSSSVNKTIPEFASLLAASMRVYEPDFLLTRLHPKIIEVYGESACQDYIEQLNVPTFRLHVASTSGPETWTFNRDGKSIDIENVYTAFAYQTEYGHSGQVAIHFAKMADNTFRWFADCGDPL